MTSMKKTAKIWIASLFTVSSLVGATSTYGHDRAFAAGAEQDVIVVYKNEDGKEAVLDQSVDVQHEFETVPAVSATVTQADLNSLVQNPDIAYIERNVPFQLTDDDVTPLGNVSPVNKNEQAQWNYQAEQPDLEWAKGYNGSGIKVAVIDSGIAPHPELTIAGGVSTVDYTTSYTDDNGHGTHVAGIIAAHNNDGEVTGMAPGVQLYAVKAMGSNGQGNLQDVLEGVDWAIQNHMDVINLSLGTSYDSQLLHNMLDQAYQAGIVVVASAGNSGAGTDTVNYPAQYSSVIAVAAVDKDLKRGSFSSTGPKVELAAPGVSIVSTYLNNGFAIASGTSQAAPHVAAMAAILKQENPSLSASSIRSKLQDYAVDLGTSGRDAEYGYGFVTFKPKADTTAPGEVSGLQASQIGTDSMTLTWQNPTDTDLAGVHVYNDHDPAKQTVQTNVYTAQGLVPDTSYTFTVKTFDQIGNESVGKTVTAKTNAVQPTSGSGSDSSTPSSDNQPSPSFTPTPSNTPAPTVTPTPVITPVPVVTPTPVVAVPVVTTPPPVGGGALLPAFGGGGGGGGGGGAPAAPRPTVTPSPVAQTPAAAPTPAQKAQQQLNTAKSSGKASDYIKASFSGRGLNNASFSKQLADLKQSLGIQDVPARTSLPSTVPVRISLQVVTKSSQYKYLDPSTINTDNITVLDGNGNIAGNVQIAMKFNRIFITPTAGGFSSGQTYTVVLEKGIKGQSSANSDQSTALSNPLVLQFTTR